MLDIETASSGLDSPRVVIPALL